MRLKIENVFTGLLVALKYKEYFNRDSVL